MKRLLGGIVVILALAVAGGPSGPPLAPAQSKSKDSTQKEKPKDSGGKKKVAGATTFEIYKDAADEYRFRLRDGDGALLCISGKGYEKKADCQKVIDAIKADAAKAKVEDNSDKKSK